MDIIGTLYAPTGVLKKDSEGFEYPVVEPIAGYHVNTPHLVEGWENRQVTPSSPTRVYAGHPTYFYVFNDEAEFKALAIEAGLLQLEEPLITEDTQEA